MRAEIELAATEPQHRLHRRERIFLRTLRKDRVHPPTFLSQRRIDHSNRTDEYGEKERALPAVAIHPMKPVGVEALHRAGGDPRRAIGAPLEFRHALGDERPRHAGAEERLRRSSVCFVRLAPRVSNGLGKSVFICHPVRELGRARDEQHEKTDLCGARGAP